MKKQLMSLALQCGSEGGLAGGGAEVQPAHLSSGERHVLPGGECTEVNVSFEGLEHHDVHTEGLD